MSINEKTVFKNCLTMNTHHCVNDCLKLKLYFFTTLNIVLYIFKLSFKSTQQKKRIDYS